MALEDEDKTAFHTSQDIYCYTKMPFGLKNAGAIYQRVIDEAFKSQIGRNLEAYVDDLVVKSITKQGLLEDILETFTSLRKINMKLNPSKCSFGEEEGKFLGHIITERGIRANPKKIEAIKNMPSPRNKKEKTDFKWTEEAEVVFQEMKKLLKELPTMTAPIAGETLILYLAASKEAISSVLIANRGQVQKPVYFVSKVLTGSELNYPAIEKLVYALVHTARRLRRYFQAHPIMVLKDQPIKQVLYKPENSGRMDKWAIELGEYEIIFSPRSSVKGQVLADYLAETTRDIEISHESKEIPPPPEQLWVMHTDGACGPEGAGAGIVLKSPEGEEYTFALRFSFPVTNNEAEYEALISGMRLVANQFNWIFDAHDELMQKYLKLVQELAVDFDLFQITQVSRTLSKNADALSKLDALTFSHFEKEIWVEEAKIKSIDTDGVSAAVEEDEPNWMTPIVEFLSTGTLPIDSIDARKIKMKASMYLLNKGILYRKYFLGPHLRCLNPTQAESIIREVHEGMCALHSGHKIVASKIMRLGYYLPSMYRDVAEVIRKYQLCQLHAPVSKAPQYPMIPVASPWPFCKRAIDIVGPFPAGPGGVKFLVVAIDYFTEWVEAKLLKTISGKQIRNFV
ncbi:uncharacterized protein [Rutidosis leptorrhynchoides]|uniref:uncharacterized protein n=1 Tax=Rutidosis leptorrhynchoides TaxID=125765 RepID=UPI003A9A12A5